MQQYHITLYTPLELKSTGDALSYHIMIHTLKQDIIPTINKQLDYIKTFNLNQIASMFTCTIKHAMIKFDTKQPSNYDTIIEFTEPINHPDSLQNIQDHITWLLHEDPSELSQVEQYTKNYIQHYIQKYKIKHITYTDIQNIISDIGTAYMHTEIDRIWASYTDDTLIQNAESNGMLFTIPGHKFIEPHQYL